jgi:hypothetical protein
MKVRWSVILAASAAVIAAAIRWLPNELDATLPVTSLVASADGQWRSVTGLGARTANVVVHHNVKWCTCPGLGVVSQIAFDNLDSAFVLGQALFRSFAAEGSKDPERRCLTVTLEAGSGRHWPWVHPPIRVFSWYLRRDGHWIFRGYAVPAGEVHDAHVRSEAWHQAI